MWMKFFILVLFLGVAWAEQCCEGIGVGLMVGDNALPTVCGQNTSVWTMKANTTGYSSCPACTVFTGARKNCTSTHDLLLTCPLFRYQTCGSISSSLEETYCKTTPSLATRQAPSLLLWLGILSVLSYL